MPKIGNGRVSNDGTGSVSFINDSQTILAASAGATTALSVTGNTEGGGSPVFLTQNSNVGNVVLNFASLVGGSNITLDVTTSPGEIIINSAGGGGGGGGINRFIQLVDGPQAYSNHSLLFSTSSGIAWTISPSAANQFLYWTGSAFAFTPNVVTSVSATGNSGQITVTGSPITGSGTFVVGLAAIGTPGTYSSVTVDTFGRVIAGISSGASSTVTLAGDVTGTGQTGASIATTLASVQAGGSYVSSSGIGVINAVDVKGRVTSSRALALSDLTNLGAAPIASPNFTGAPTAPTPANSDNTTKLATTAWVNLQGYLKSPLVATGDASGTSSGSSIVLTLANVIAAGTYGTVTVDTKGRVISGTQSSGGVTNVALRSPNATLTVSGSPITSSGTFAVDLTSVIVAGTYNGVTVDTYGRVVGNRALIYSDLPTEVQVSLMPFSFPGAPAVGIDIIVPVVQATTIPNGLATTAGYAVTPATSSAAFTLSYVRGGTTTVIGTITFAASVNAATINYSLGGDLQLLSGDVLIMSTPGSADSTLNNVGITIYTLKV